ncbi:MAG TPA: hypothetical protein VMX56_04390 [Anaerolineales bacterium]|nr:hypothetical protein [Anaerolineales bacterium]
MCYTIRAVTDSYHQENINLNAKLFVRQRIISGAEATSTVTAQDSAGIVTVNTTVVHTVVLPLAGTYPKGFFTRYLAPNAGTVANVIFAQELPDTINLKAANITLAADDDWVLLVSDGTSNWTAFIGA